MRSIIIVALVLPFFATAQINRSAREFASERITEYINSKLFKDLPYKPVSFGQLKEYSTSRTSPVAWTLEHKFEITATRTVADQKTAVTKEYKFQFYLDEKMKVLRAESFFTY